MDYSELLEKYEVLLGENRRLTKENDRLKAQLGIAEHKPAENPIAGPTVEKSIRYDQSTDDALFSSVNNRSDSISKIKLFMSLFKGRDDVYARRWENKKKGTFGYSPSCVNEWKPGICDKRKGGCAACGHRQYAAIDEKVIDDHLRGKIIAGIYPIGIDDTCLFLAIDFDEGEWRKDIRALREVCGQFEIPVAVERSRSGKGAHAWFFFDRKIPAASARRLGSSLITHAMNTRHEISFKSYDSLFPNQDTLPKGGLGNLIALPLQKAAREENNSEFLNEDFAPYSDQWAFLGAIRRLSEGEVERLILRVSGGNELGVLRIVEEEEELQKPWETAKATYMEVDLPREIKIVKGNMLYIPKSGLSQRALNHLKRLAAFKNPEFYKAQALRLPTWGKPRIISCADETSEYLCLPRGCEMDLKALFSEQGKEIALVDKNTYGKKIEVEFKGALRNAQPLAVDKLLGHDLGVLSATTAFGKTVVAIKLIAERKVNTLIIVNRTGLVTQWRKRIMEFLTIHETLPVPNSDGERRRGRKKIRTVIGQLGDGKDRLSSIIDIALMQSLGRMGEVKECVKNYGMIIVDECHHAAAFSLDNILKHANARYIYGLTATPTRKDGHHPIIFMRCGPIRYRDDAKQQAEKRPFKHFVLPRFTSYRVPIDKDEKDVSIQEHYGEIAANERRNQLIVDDVFDRHENGGNCLVLTERIAHVDLLTRKLRERIPGVISLTGGMGTKETEKILKQIADTPVDNQLMLVATGKYIGEGFDEARLDTLFLTMPISWKGTLQQYAGRLHRLFENKKEVLIYDYVDVHIKMLEKMYHKRQNGYASIGYKAKGGFTAPDSIDMIFDKSNFSPVYINDLLAAKKEILIVSPFVTRKRTVQMMPHIEAALRNRASVTVVTRPVEDYRTKDTALLQGTLDLLQNAGVSLICRPNIHQKFAVIDRGIVWYGSINLLSFGGAEESMMRLESPNIANELLKILES